MTVHEDHVLRTWDAASGKLLRVLSRGQFPNLRVTVVIAPITTPLLAFEGSWASDGTNVFVWNLAFPGDGTPWNCGIADGSL